MMMAGLLQPCKAESRSVLVVSEHNGTPILFRRPQNRAPEASRRRSAATRLDPPGERQEISTRSSPWPAPGPGMVDSPCLCSFTRELGSLESTIQGSGFARLVQNLVGGAPCGLTDGLLRPKRTNQPPSRRRTSAVPPPRPPVLAVSLSHPQRLPHTRWPRTDHRAPSDPGRHRSMVGHGGMQLAVV